MRKHDYLSQDLTNAINKMNSSDTVAVDDTKNTLKKSRKKAKPADITLNQRAEDEDLDIEFDLQSFNKQMFSLSSSNALSAGGSNTNKSFSYSARHEDITMGDINIASLSAAADNLSANDSMLNDLLMPAEADQLSVLGSFSFHDPSHSVQEDLQEEPLVDPQLDLPVPPVDPDAAADAAPAIPAGIFTVYSYPPSDTHTSERIRSDADALAMPPPPQPKARKTRQKPRVSLKHCEPNVIPRVDRHPK